MGNISCYRFVLAGFTIFLSGLLFSALSYNSNFNPILRFQRYSQENNYLVPKNVTYYLADKELYEVLPEKIPSNFASRKLPWRDGSLPSSDQFFLDLKIVAPQYSILPAPCWVFPKPIYLMIIAVSRPNGFALRKAVRSTWGSLADPECGVRLIFIVGRTRDKSVQESLITEAEEYGDVLQSNAFEDNYRAQALKTIYLFQWSGTFCPGSVFTVKIDDDNWLNLERYVGFLKKQTNLDQVYGALFGSGTEPLRETNSKYVSPREDYPPDLYPDYLSGMLYAFPTKHLAKVVYIAKKLNVGINEDVFIGGIVATTANLTRASVPDYGWGHEPHDNADTKCPKKDRICMHYSNVKWMQKLWDDPCHPNNKLCIPENRTSVETVRRKRSPLLLAH